MQRPDYSTTLGGQRTTAATLSGTVAGLPHALPDPCLGNQQQVRHRLSGSQQQAVASGDCLVEDVRLVQPSLEYAYGAGTTRADAAKQTSANRKPYRT